jgi:Tol biopolymer transport system component
LGLAILFLSLAAAGWMALATIPRITRSGPDVVISWPTNGLGQKLQFTESLLPTNEWRTVTNSPQQKGNEFRVTNAITGSSRFYRLSTGTNSPPSLTTLQLSQARLAFDETASLTLVTADPDNDLRTAEITLSNTLGSISREIPAAWLGFGSNGGNVQATLKPEKLVYGLNAFSIRFKDARGQISETRSFTVELQTGSGTGTAPAVSLFFPEAQAYNQPPGAKDRLVPKFACAYEDPDADIERVRIRMAGPDGFSQASEYQAAAFRIEGSQGALVMPVTALVSSHALGEYQVELTLIDRAGNFSLPVSTGFQLVGSGGQSPVHIAAFTPDQGIAGTEVQLLGEGFEPDPAANRVELGGLTVEVLGAEPDHLSVRIPPNAWPGRFIVRNSRGSSVADSDFTVLPEIRISPAGAELPAGQALHFEVEAAAVGSLQMDWAVDSLPGGNAALGTISSNGLYVAPPTPPPGGVVTISASPHLHTNLAGLAQVRILPPLPHLEAGLVAGAGGGSVRSKDGRASISIPPNAFSGTLALALKVLHGTNVPAPPSGERILGALELLPDGTQFSTPARVLIPLNAYRPPGTTLALRQYHPETGSYSLPLNLVVGSSGEQAIGEVTHFSQWVVTDPAVIPVTLSPTITSVEPPSAQEGLKVPVLFTGQNLLPGLEAVVLFNGVPSADILPQTLYALGDRAGVVLDIQPIPNLPRGANRVYTLRLQDPSGSLQADIPFAVVGLDELIVRSGETRNSTGAENGRYSTVVIENGGTFNTSVGAFDLEATGAIDIRGRLLANGKNGQPGSGTQAGPGGTSPAFGGHGGQGRDDSGCTQLPIFGIPLEGGDYDCAGLEFYGADSNRPVPGSPPFGTGGPPGVNVSIVQDFLDAVLNGVSCALTLGANTISCVQFAVDVVEVVGGAQDVALGEPLGKQGFPGASPVLGFGSGGGGGGGGGQFDAVISSIPGGGGGAGGDGGRPVKLVTGRSLHLDGEINTSGGRGGDGAETSGTLPLPGATVPVEAVYTGGGGGGGSGGLLTLVTADGIVKSVGRRHVYTDGGLNGIGGIRVYDDAGRLLKTLIIRTSRQAQGRGGGYLETDPLSPVLGAKSPVLLPKAADGTDEVDHRVTTRSLLHARFRHDLIPLSLETAPIQIVHAGSTNTFTLRRTPTFEFSGLVLLKPGFNKVTVTGMHPLLDKSILFLAGPDSDGDGLYDTDEADLGSDPTRADTDQDGLSDQAEVLAEGNPLDPDADKDGLPDGQEITWGTSLAEKDTDGDGSTDGAEVVLGSNPLQMASVPGTIPSSVLFAHTRGPEGSQLTVIHPQTGTHGLLGFLNGGNAFGVEFDKVPALFVAQLTNLSQHRPIEQVSATTGPFGGPAAASISSLAITYSPVGDIIYGVENESGALDFKPTGQLLAIDPGTGAATRIGNAGPDQIRGLAALRDGRLVAVLQNIQGSTRLVQIDRTAGGVAQEIGETGFGNITGLALGAGDILFAAQQVSPTESKLLTVDLQTGQGTVVCSVHRAVFDLAALTFGRVPELLSVNRYGTAAGNGSSDGAMQISSDGRYVAFQSQASDLVAIADTNETVDVFIRDLVGGTTELVSINQSNSASAGAVAALGGSYLQGMSSDGRYVYFTSTAADLTPQPGFPGLPNAFRRDRWTGTTELVSGGPGSSGQPQGAFALMGRTGLSADGRIAVFSSDSDNLDPLRSNPNWRDVYARDLDLGVTTLVSHNGSSGLSGPSEFPIVSANGHTVVFGWRPSTANYSAVMVKDLVSGVLTNVSSAAGVPRPGNLYDVSADGRFVVFASNDQLLTPGGLADTNRSQDVFYYDLQTHVRQVVSVSVNGAATGSGDSYLPRLSSDGRYVVFTSYATNLVMMTDTNQGPDLFLRDMHNGKTTLLSVDVSGTATGTASTRFAPFGQSWGGAISGDGRRVVFVSTATNLVNLPSDRPGFENIFARDLISHTTSLLSTNYRGTATGLLPSGQGLTHTISSNATVATFMSLSTNLVRIADTNSQPDLFWRGLGP